MASISNTIELSHSALQSTPVQIRSQSNSNQFQQQPNHLVYQGDEASFSQLAQRMSEEEIDKVVDCSICIIGEEIKPGNVKCLVLTLLIGVCCIFPFFFFCCQWWKRAVSQIFQIKEEIYEDIGKILKGRKLQNVNIKVYDNFLTENKIKCLARNLNKRLKNIKLTLINEAGAFDMNDNQYSNFLSNTKCFLKLSLKEWHISWYKQYLTQQKNAA